MSQIYVSKFPEDKPVEVEVVGIFAKALMLTKKTTGGIVYVSKQYQHEFLKGVNSEPRSKHSKYKTQNTKQTV